MQSAAVCSSLNATTPSRVREFLRDLFVSSRAQTAWKNAHLLDASGIATAKPIALVERRFGPLRTTAYLVTEFVTGVSGKTVFQCQGLSDGQAEDLAKGNRCGPQPVFTIKFLSHGDLKASNLLYPASEPVFIDIDAVRRHRVRLLASGRQLRDRQQLPNLAESSPFIGA